MSNRSKFTPQRRAAILASLSEDANVSDAARRAGIGRVTLYSWRARYPDFAAEWDEAVERGIDALEDIALRRSMRGIAQPVFYKGRVCGQRRQYSDNLLMFMLRSRRPWRYARAAEMARRVAEDRPPVTVELVHYGDIAEMDAQAARDGLAVRTPDGVRYPGGAPRAMVPTAAEALADRLAGGSCLSPP